MRKPNKKTSSDLLLATAMTCGILTSGVNAQSTSDVLLRSADGSIELQGELVEFTDDFYVVKTSLGNLRVSAARVDCQGATCPVFETEAADVKVAGASAVGEGLMPLLLDGYGSFLEAEASIIATGNQGEIIAKMIGDNGFGDELNSYLVTSTDTAEGFQRLLNNETEITMATRRILREEARALKNAGAGRMISPEQEHVLAVDSIVVAMHPSNPVDSLTMDQVAKIYSGEFTNWTQVGGPDLAIELVAHKAGSDIRNTFEQRIFGETSAASDTNAIVVDNYNAVASYLTKNPGAIGYTGYAFLRGAKKITLVNECNIPMVPDKFASKTEEYSLQRRLYLYNRADVDADEYQEFLQYATSEDADSVILKSGFIDLGVERRDQSADSERAKVLISSPFDEYERQIADDMLALMGDYDRLSTTFRFRTGSTKLDERGALDLKRLVDFLEVKGDIPDLRLVGFTDDNGAFSANLSISQERADAMADILQNALAEADSEAVIRTAGFGAMSPAACNLTDAGRAINRRVEVWIKRQS